MAVMVRPPYVNGEIIAPSLQLIPVVGDIRRKVGGNAIISHQNLILIPSEGRGLKPKGTLLLIGVSPLGQSLNGLLHRLAIVKFLFREPDIEVDPIVPEVPL